MKFLLLNFLLISLFSFAYGQSGQIHIRFIGNCGLALTDGTSNIYVDFPYKSGAHNYMEYDQSELENVKPNSVFLFTHKHADHYSKKLLKKMSGTKYGPWNIDELQNITTSIPDFTIEAFKTQHKVFGISFEHYSYLITWHHKKIYISGDTENADTLALQQNLDWAFIPVWLVMDAKAKDIKLGTISKMYGIYHIAPKDSITNDEKNTNIKLLNKQGETIIMPY